MMQRGILITGGAHGIGKQICLDFLRQGDKVCFIDINEEASKPVSYTHLTLPTICSV